MMQSFEKHIRLVKKDQELLKLFEAADRRRKLLLHNKSNDANGNKGDKSDLNTNYILRPLRSTDNLIAEDFIDNKITSASIPKTRNSHPYNTYNHSYDELPETNLDSEEYSLKISENNVNRNENSLSKFSDNLNKVGYHNSSFATHSSSSDEINTSNYCQFFPATSTSNNTTSSSHFSLNCQEKVKAIDDLKSESVTKVETEIGNCYNRRSSVVFYPSGSPLISYKYQGSPVVRIDNKIRAGEVDYLIDFPKAPSGKPPAIPRRQTSNKISVNSLLFNEKNLSQSNVNNETVSPKSFSPPLNSNNTKSIIIPRTKRKMLEEHMLKRFSVGDYSTRSLIEWENNLNMREIQQLSISGDLLSQNSNLLIQQSPPESGPTFEKSLSNQLEEAEPVIYNYTSEINIHHYSSSESFKDTQVSFSVQNPKDQEIKRKSKRSGFIQRSLNDIFVAFRNANVSEKLSGSRKFIFSQKPSNTHFKFHRKRESITSDFLYSAPPFVRRYLPPDISGGTKLVSQGAYQTTDLPSSTPNLIAELDPTFQERNISKTNESEAVNIRNPNSKRNKSYRLSFIENAHTVTTKKLTSTNLTSPTKTFVPRFVQPRRRTGFKNLSVNKKSGFARMEQSNSRLTGLRSHSSNRFSCIQQ